MYSNVPSTQVWLSQFLPEDKPLARKLIDELVYVDTDSVVSSLGSRLSSLIDEYESVAIFPIRELNKEIKSQNNDADITITEHYFDRNDDDKPPIMQSAEEALGSEAFISNLITQLSRRYSKKILSKEGMRALPTINAMRAKKTRALFLVDDLIGSGNRTEEFLNSVYNHPSIKSWISGDLLKIYIVAYMGADRGVELIKRWCKKHKNTVLEVLNKCPMLSVFPEVLSLCERYADVNERLPLGYGDNPVRVIFSHSAPNNLPAILFRNRDKLKTRDKALRGRITNWMALFPKRALPESIKADFSAEKTKFPLRILLKEILRIVDSSPSITEDDIVSNILEANAMKSLLVSHCVSLGWISQSKGGLYISDHGKYELAYFNKKSAPKPIANNTNNYYPLYVSRAFGHTD